MNNLLQHDLFQMDQLLDAIKNQSSNYLENIDTRHTTTSHIPVMENGLKDIGAGALQTLENFNRRFEPVIVSSSGPRYWGYVIGGTTPAAIAGDWLASVYDQDSFATTGQGDISAIIELETIQLLLDLLNLPRNFIGGFVTGATMSNFTCLAVARQWVGKKLGKDFAKYGVKETIHILSATPHSSSVKSLSLLGIGSNNIIEVKTAQGNREAMDMEDLEKKIIALDGQPFILISSAGTVNTVDFDDFISISKLRMKYDFYWHIDAAFGGFAACSQKHAYLLAGWENADSITVDCHKWMNVPYESAVFFVREEHKILQVETFQNSNAPYLGNQLIDFSFLNFLPENSRRLKALPAWFSLNAYGKQGYKEIVEDCIEMANLLGRFIEGHNAFELLAPVRLNTVCFTLSGADNQEKVNSFVQKLNATRQVFMTPTVYNNKKGIRAAFVNWRTRTEDINLATSLMSKIIEEVV